MSHKSNSLIFQACSQGEVHVPLDYILNVEEEEYIKKNHILLKYHDVNGKQYIKSKGKFKPISVLQGIKKTADCIEEKHEINLNTYLDASSQVPKTDIKIKFRGELDLCIALVLEVYFQISNSTAKKWLISIRSILGHIMSATASNTQLKPFIIHELDCETLYKASHYPYKYIGHDHIVPDFSHGYQVALINKLRTQIRLLESTGFQAYTYKEKVIRPDILYCLNRLSSAIYVLMLCVLVEEKQGSFPKFFIPHEDHQQILGN